MGESLNQPSSVEDDGPTGCKLLLRGDKALHVWGFAGTARISIGSLRASSRGNTEDAGVIRIHWA